MPPIFAILPATQPRKTRGAATGVTPTGPGQAAIAERARRWRFAVRDQNDEDSLERMHAAARDVDADLPPIARALAAIHNVTGETA